MITVTRVTVTGGVAGEDAVLGGAAGSGGSSPTVTTNRNTWYEFTAAGSKHATVTVPILSLPSTSHATIVGRRIYVTKAGAPATGVTPLNSQWFLILADPATTNNMTSNTYLPQGTLTVASTSGFASSGNLVVTTDLGVEVVAYSAIGSGTTFTGCTGGYGKLTNGAAVTQPMIPNNSDTTYDWNIADGSLAATQPPVVATSGAIIDQCYLAANTSYFGNFGGRPENIENGGYAYVEVTSGAVSWKVQGV
jgi:hypothetical protein